MRWSRNFLCSLLAIGVATCVAHAQTPGESGLGKRYKDLRENRQGLSDSTRLTMLFDVQWDYVMETFPEWGTWEGYTEGNNRWTDNSTEGIARRRAELQWPISVMESIGRSKLDDEGKLNYDLFMRNMRELQEEQQFQGDYLAVNQLGGVQQSAPRLLSMMPAATVADYENILARMNSLPMVLENDVTHLQKGLAAGVTPPKVTLRDVPQQVLNLLTDDPMKSPLLQAFARMPETIPAAERERLKGAAVQAYNAKMAPAFRKFHSFLTDTYIPGARETIGMSAMPNGKAWYAQQVKSYTTTTKTPEEIFDIGMGEVARIRKRMEEVIEGTGFDGDFAAFTEFLRTDPQFYYADAESLLQGYRDICKRADPELVKLFGRLPRLPYGVLPVPEYAEKSQTTAYYHSGSVKAGRPGYFYANTYDLASRPKWEMEALALHEAVPGHHLQISIAQELEELPRFRRDGGYTAFVEGWGLYSESLGEEMGFYQDPYSKFGQLTYEIWRAIRLVVDVGIHQKGWTRQQAIDFFTENSGKSLHDIEVEVDRYIVWPGQALAYKIGELKIKELRAFAEKELGEGFNIREFHDELLGNAPLPLDILETHMREWVAEQKANLSAK